MRSVIPLWCLILLAIPAAAQDAGVRPGEAYLIPQTVFVGDPGRLVLPLKAALPGAGSVVLDNPKELPASPVLIISRVELENRGENHRLIVDFRAFMPGVIDLPPIEIASFTFTGLTVNVASILEAEGNNLVLSGPAPPLAVPGALGMIYATVLGIAVLIAGFVLLVIKGAPAFRRWRERFRRRRMLLSMGRVLRYLRNTLDKGGSGKAPEVLDRLSTEFKTFLGLFTGMNCRAMIGEEFLCLPSLTSDPSGPFLRDFFRCCDALRFSGAAIADKDVTALLDQAWDFIGKIDARQS
jgi:hypothetical protein